MKKNISMQDIADFVGVSKVTVSKVLRGQNDVSESVREKILKAANEFGYKYRGFCSTNISKITILSSKQYYGSNDSFYINFFKDLSSKLSRINIASSLCMIDKNIEKALSVPDKLKNGQADGIIVLGQLSKDYLKTIIGLNVPLVFLDFYCSELDIPSVSTDNFFNSYELTRSIINLGHKKLGFVGNYCSTSSIQDRYLGFCKALIENHIKINDSWIIKDRDECGRFMDLSLPDTLPTAFVCNCDEIALQLMNKLKAMGLCIPRDISVAGFDDSQHCLKCDPKITTVHVNVDEMSFLAVKSILKAASGGKIYPKRMSVGGRIVFRDSVTKPV